ncbi:MAG: PorP/SprF family type IX secretion system membrane protein [Saprospiraceae bacterium]|nr:PorP/SprF family type IX secretion system membrane protein [Saprospiraceae bacterium]
MRYSCFLIFWFVAACLGAQDLHYSQYYLNPMSLSPAATGMFHGDLRVACLYRSQWPSVPVGYETFSGAVDWKALERGRNRLAVGLMLQNDQAGDAGLSWVQLGGSIGVAHALSAEQTLGLGFGVSLVQRHFDLQALTFKNQWGGDSFNAALPTKETFYDASNFAPSFSTGLNWRYQSVEKRTQVNAGGGIAHLNRTVVNLGDFAYLLPRRISFYGNAVWQLHYLYDLVLMSEWQSMADAEELLFGAGIRYILSSGLANHTAIQFAVNYRLKDAIIPSIQIERNNWLVGISYDWNVSSFNTATNGRGGMEIAVIWRKIPVPALKTVKSCPPF